MADPIFVRSGVLVPPDALEWRAIRSSGPGGQNVNKVASKVELRVDLGRIQGLDETSLLRLHRIVGRRLDAGGRLLVTSQRTRDQHRNLEDAREKVRGWIVRALEPGKPRRATAPGAAGRERRLSAKHLRSERKAERRRPDALED
jgi:ribosome-associated protein